MTIKQIGRNNYAYYGKIRIKNDKDKKLKEEKKQYANYYKSGFLTKREAREAEVFFRAAFIKRGNEKVRDTYLLYRQERSLICKKRTIRSIDNFYYKYIDPEFGNRYWRTIDYSEWNLWRASLLSKGIALSTMNKIIIYLKSIDGFAYDRYKSDFGTKPLTYFNNRNYKYSKRRCYRPKENFWTYAEFKKNIIKVSNQDDKDLYTFLFLSGLRSSEACGLKWKHIDFKECTITVENGHSSDDHSDYSLKSLKSYRTIDMQDSLFSLLKQRFKRKKKVDGWNLEYYVFGPGIIPANMRDLRYRLRDFLLEHREMKYITLHGFRHSHATYLIQKGFVDDWIARRLGHSVRTLRTTYAHIYKESRDVMNEELDEIYKEIRIPEWYRKEMQDVSCL